MNDGLITDALIIDDDIDTCILLKRILGEKNIKSSYVNTIQEAKNIFDTVNPMLIFLDNKLPDGYGTNFLPIVKEKFPKAPIIMITAHSSDFNRKVALVKGAVSFIPKPFNSLDIHEALNLIMHSED